MSKKFKIFVQIQANNVNFLKILLTSKYYLWFNGYSLNYDQRLLFGIVKLDGPNSTTITLLFFVEIIKNLCPHPSP